MDRLIRRASGLDHRERKFITEVADSTIAEANGELSGALHNLCEERNFGYPPGMVVFNVQGISTQYSTPYAMCQLFPALKIDKRYFQLEEVETKGSTLLPPRCRRLNWSWQQALQRMASRPVIALDPNDVAISAGSRGRRRTMLS